MSIKAEPSAKRQGRRAFGLSAVWVPVAATVALSSPAAAQNLVANPGFESVSSLLPAAGINDYCQATSWMSTGNCGAAYLYTTGNQRSGTYSLQIGDAALGAGNISQSISGLQAGRYDFSFWYEVFAARSGAFTASLGGQTFSFSTSTQMTAFTQFNQQLTLGAGSTTVAFGNGTGSGETAIDDVSLIFLGPNTLTPFLPQGAPTNAVNVAAGIDNFINNAGLFTGGFQTLSNLSGQQLSNALVQLDGEASTGSERAAFQLMNQFLGLMLDPFVDGRFGDGVSSFAPERADLPPEIAMAYASILKAPPKPPQDNRWTVWGTGFGGSSHTSGDANAGSSDLTANTYGFASGADYHFTRDTLVGFALAGAGTNWGLSQSLGGGRSDAFQAGVYGKTGFGPVYLAADLAYTENWFTTNRVALGDQLTANFNGESFGGRLESGYRLVMPSNAGRFEISPYAAIQAQSFHTPNYSETDLTGGGLGLNFNAMSATDMRSELGARFADMTAIDGMPLILRAKLAWAHDWVDNPELNATFQSLPGSSFIVNGAPIPSDSALVSAGAELHINTRWSLIAKFDGEFAGNSELYAGTGTLRYTW